MNILKLGDKIMYEILRLGDAGDMVKILQEKLKRLGYYNALITGSFGLSTEEGVRAFQQDENLEVTGIVDSATWERLNYYTEPRINVISVYPTLSLNDKGPYVTDLQTKLKALLYYTKDINGEFDLETELAVKRFQLNNGITAGGIVSSETWNVLNRLYGNLRDCAIQSDDEVSDSYTTYTVQNGDTLYSIARKYNTTVDAIKSLNNLTSNTITVGQILKIPVDSSLDYDNYTVQSGDTLYAIARRYNTTIDEIKRINNLTSNTITVGQILKIPAYESDDYINYVVVKNDTLYSIARKYNTTIDAIKNLNNLTSNTLNIGQVLKIPTSTDNYIYYTVVRGDTLYAIAERYNTTVNTIKNLNNLSSNILSIGQILKIPIDT